jgi:transcriptional regulator of acetoin/glycerol metabolism
MVSEIERLAGRDLQTALPPVVADSWRRCLESYNLPPDVPRRADVLSRAELRDATDVQETLVRAAGSEVDSLFKHLACREHIVSLASPGGVMLLFRCDPYWLDELTAAGVLLGSVWPEELQGTNGVGTCIKVGTPLSIVGPEHYNTAVKGLTCTVAPIFGSHSQIEGVLNVTSMRVESTQSAAFLREVVNRSAKLIELRYFKQRNSRHRLIKVETDDHLYLQGAHCWLAVDDNDRIVDSASGDPAALGRPASALIDLRLDEFLASESERHHSGRIVATEEDSVAPVRGRSPSFHGRGWSRRSTVVPPFADPRLDENLVTAERLLVAGIPIAVQGETGTGKSTFARTVGDRVRRGEGSLFVVSCAVPPPPDTFPPLDNLVGSTLVLDQIDDASEPTQRHLLALLDDDNALRRRHVSLITTCTEDISRLLETGRLRRELADRLRGASLRLAPLRTSPDLRTVIRNVFHAEAEELRKPGLALSEEMLLVLSSYDWPGNLRELRQALRHALVLAKEPISVDDLPDYIVGPLGERNLKARSQHEAARIEAALRHNGGNVSKTARYLGISRATLYRKIQIGRRQ